MIAIILAAATMTAGNHEAVTPRGIAMKPVNMREILLLKEGMEKGISVTIEREIRGKAHLYDTKEGTMILIVMKD